MQKLKVKELEKYLKHFIISLRGKKDDQARRIFAHVCKAGGIGHDTYTATRKEPKELFTSESETSGTERVTARMTL